jgi:hypothetical protein
MCCSLSISVGTLRESRNSSIVGVSAPLTSLAQLGVRNDAERKGGSARPSLPKLDFHVTLPVKVSIHLCRVTRVTRELDLERSATIALHRTIATRVSSNSALFFAVGAPSGVRS